nr:hypothetical protein [uncultured Allomuricauda sp.]
MKYDEKILERIANYLNIRFPVATFSKDLEYSKGVVSQYYNGKREISESFRKSFENYYNIKFSDFSDGKAVEQKSKIEDFVLNDRSFYNPKAVSDLFRLLIRNHSLIKENEIYPLYRDFIIKDSKTDDLNDDSRYTLLGDE